MAEADARRDRAQAEDDAETRASPKRTHAGRRARARAEPRAPNARCDDDRDAPHTSCVCAVLLSARLKKEHSQETQRGRAPRLRHRNRWAKWSGPRHRARAHGCRRLRRPMHSRVPSTAPISVASFSEFSQIFGGLWQPSTLSYAVEQFFENGGREAFIVRVANGARPPTLTLPAGTEQLRLDRAASRLARIPARLGGLRRHRRERARSLQPGAAAGARRRLRADRGAGDFPAAVRAAGIRPAGVRHPAWTRVSPVSSAPLPAQRPDRSVRNPGSPIVGYINSNTDGDDGGPLTDYDVIGSATDRTGMFALRDAPTSTCCAFRR